MLRNYILISLRLLIRNKVFSLINILGLSIGMACCVLIYLFIQDEFNFEKGFADHNRIFRINSTVVHDGESTKFPYTAPPIAPGLAEALPEIECATRTMKPPGVEQNIVRYNEKVFFEKNVLLADSNFLKVFNYKLKSGNPAIALANPSSVLLSEKAAKRIFGSADPLNETIIISSGQTSDTLLITGVVANTRFPSHLDADFYLSMNSNGGSWLLAQTSWDYNNFIGAYIKLKDHASGQSVEAKIPQIIERYAGEELRKSGRQKMLSLQPLDAVRLYSSDMPEQPGSITYIYIIGTIGLFILILACINFMNLTTAKSAQRSGEIGIRKSLGASRGVLVQQFLGESMVIVMFSMLLSFLIVILALPYYSNVMHKELNLNQANLRYLICAILLISTITALIAGSYPAFFLSSLKPSLILKGQALSGDRSKWLRKGFVVLQFVITISLISSIVIIQKQLRFIQSKSLGFEQEQVVMIPLRTKPAAVNYMALKESFKKLSGVNEVSGTSSLPSTMLLSDWIVYKQGSSRDQIIRHHVVNVDRDYFKTMNIRLLAGRDFIIEQDNLAGDTINIPKIIVNESSLKALHIPLEEAPGTSIFFEPGGERYEFTIVGVVNDFHQFSLHQEISPLIFLLPNERTNFNYLAASIDVKEYRNLYQQMKDIWNERIHDVPFEMVFLSENVRMLYSTEARISTLLRISTIIALIISCLGLYGLSVYVAELRTKEIGIRKVAGATVKNITGMLSKEYIILILISFLISIPLSYFPMSKWLQGFAYKTSPGIMVFVISGFFSLVISWLTISFESIKAAKRNPVETLKSP